MLTLLLHRNDQNDLRTLGSISTEDGTIYAPATLELPWENNEHNVSCIPAGSYSCEYTNHPKHGWVFQVMDVPDRDEILLHVGNFPRNTEGCILLGQNVAVTGDSIEHSSAAFKVFMKMLEGVEQFTLVVSDVSSFGGAQ